RRGTAMAGKAKGRSHCIAKSRNGRSQPPAQRTGPAPRCPLSARVLLDHWPPPQDAHPRNMIAIQTERCAGESTRRLWPVAGLAKSAIGEDVAPPFSRTRGVDRDIEQYPERSALA